MNLDDLLPPDNGTLGQWIKYAGAAWGEEHPVVGYLEGLADRFGKLYEVEFTTHEFHKHLNSLIFAYERDEESWNFYAGVA